MPELQTATGKTKAFGLVRDSLDRPVIDDGANLPREILSMLTTNELEELRNDRFAFSRT